MLSSIQQKITYAKNRLRELKAKFSQVKITNKLTAKRIIELHGYGQRDFRNLLIVNQSFAGADLSGSNFTDTEFRGCDFKSSVLRRCKFDKSIFRFNVWQIGNISINGIEDKDSAPVSFIEIVFDSVFLLTRGTAVSIIFTVLILSIILDSIQHEDLIGGASVLALKLSILSFLILYLRIFLIENKKILAKSFCSSFKEADLHASSFLKANIRNCDFSYSNLNYSTFKGALIQNSRFEGCSLDHTNFLSAHINKNCEFSIELDLIHLCVTRNAEKMNFRGRKMNNMRLDDVSFRGADLTEADLSNCNLRFGDFSGAKMDKCSLARSDLTRARFENASLIDSDLGASKFINASLRNTLLPGAKALGSLFRKSDLTGACIANWQINSETRFKNILCEYIYLDYYHKGDKSCLSKRIPENVPFKENEFELIMNQYFDLLESVFRQSQSSYLAQENSGLGPNQSASLSEVVKLRRTRPTGIDPITFDRLQLYQAVLRLPDAQFFMLQEMLEIPYENRVRLSANVSERTATLFEWVVSPIGCGTESLKQYLSQIIRDLH